MWIAGKRFLAMNAPRDLLFATQAARLTGSMRCSRKRKGRNGTAGTRQTLTVRLPGGGSSA